MSQNTNPLFAAMVAAVGGTSLLVFGVDKPQKADGSPLFYQLAKNGRPGVPARYRIIAPGNDVVHGLGAKSTAASGLEYIEAYVVTVGADGKKQSYSIKLFPNQKTADNHPAYRGYMAMWNGQEEVRVADVSGFLKKDKNGKVFLSLALQEPYVKTQTEDVAAEKAAKPDAKAAESMAEAEKAAADNAPSGSTAADDLDDMIPF